MKTRTVLTAATIAAIAAVSATALAFGPGKGMDERGGRAEMQAFRDAVMSGALTDAELTTLQKEREAMRAQVQKLRADGELSTADREALQKLRQGMHDKAKALIANSDRTQARSSWPSQLLPEPGRHKGGMHGGHGGKHGGWGDADGARAYHAAAQSGALTNAEIATLQQQRQALHAKMQELINNADRTQPRQPADKTR